MSFQEKSAWIMSLALALGGAFYFVTVSAMSAEINQLAPPTIGAVVVYTLILIALAIIGHVAIAVFAPKEANASLDERERMIFARAGNFAGYVFGFGVILSLGMYLVSYSGNALFYGVFASLMIGQLSEYAARVFLYRVAV
ncbi:MAG: hypothetical protein K0U72_12415 [Gammaproteobacteria bacterium]|nr:hypothetical protein [Gammaproteobacteria bacterium]